MNLIYVFDNYCFNISNTYIINNIKRWVIYELVSMLSNNIYENIILIKTGPALCSCKINLKKDDAVNKVIQIINSIIYKKYDVYSILNLKNIIDELNDYSDQVNKIIIFSAIHEPGLSQINKDYLNKILEKFNTPIIFYNIAKYSFLDLSLKNIKEIFIDFRTTDIYKIIFPEVFTINQIDFADEQITNYEIQLIKNIFNNIQSFNFSNEINNTIILDFTEFDDSYNFETIKSKPSELNKKSNFILDYVLMSSKIERILIKKIINILDNEDFKNIIINFLNINLNNYHIDKTIIGLLKNFKNIIEKLYNRNINICPINIPIKQLTDESLNIKFILEFYQEIYPKLINYHFDSNKKNFKIQKLNTTEISMNNLKKINKIDQDNISESSLQYMFSNLTMSNWFDEFNEFNPFGILIKYNISKFSYKGLIDEYSSIISTYPNMIVGSISNNWVSLYDYYQIILADINHEDNVAKLDQLNLNNFVIIDNLNGDSNIMLPIYINKNHWELVKNIWSYHMTFINNSFEYEYNKKMNNIYYMVLLKCYNLISDYNKSNNNLLRLFICLLRTCAQINIDNKYINSVKGEKEKYFNYIKKSINLESENKYNKINNIFIDYLFRSIQLIVSFNSDIDNIKEELLYIRNLILYTHIENTYKIDFWEKIKNISQEARNNEINILKNECIQSNKSWFDLEIDIICLCEFINSIYKIKNFNQFLKYVDSVNGCIPLDNSGLINCEIIRTIYDTLKNPKTFDINYYLNTINLNNYINTFIDRFNNQEINQEIYL